METERLSQALRTSIVALDDWLHIYAGEFCDLSKVRESKERIAEFGTVGYIAHVRQENRAALASLATASGDSQNTPASVAGAVEGDAVERACDAYDEAAESDVPVDPPSCDMRYMIPALAAAYPALTAQVAALTAQCEGLRKELSEARGMLVACYAMAQNEVVVVTVPDDWRKANLAVSNMSIERDALRIKLAAIAAGNGEGV